MIKLFLPLFFTLTFFSASFAEERQLRLGLISDKPEDKIKEYAPLLNYVSEHLKGFNIKGGMVSVARDVDDMIEKIKKGEVDMVFESAFSTIEMKEKAGMIPRMLVWRKGVRDYRTLFFVRRESPIKTLKDIKGKVIVFEDPKSTSAYAIPKAELRRNGMTVLPLKEKGIPDDAVRYVFAGEELNQVFYVIQKKADAGAFNDNDWDEIPEKVRADLMIIHETGSVLRYMASFHPELPDKLRDTIEEIFKEMDKDPEGQKALKEASRITKIEKLTEGDIKSLEYVKELVRFIE